MGQNADVWQSERNLEREKDSGRKKDESATGRDIPGGDGTVGDEQVNAVGNKGPKGKTGQDHSTEHYEIHDPAGGVGAVQDREDTRSDIARISD
jgi:hypothetical protein